MWKSKFQNIENLKKDLHGIDVQQGDITKRQSIRSHPGAIVLSERLATLERVDTREALECKELGLSIEGYERILRSSSNNLLLKEQQLKEYEKDLAKREEEISLREEKYANSTYASCDVLPKKSSRSSLVKKTSTKHTLKEIDHLREDLNLQK
eukprot:UN31178